MTEVHDLVRWANAADVQGTRQIGQHAAARVLVQLAAHADDTAAAWPSQETLAEEISGMSRRDVRNALAVLEDAKLIERDGTRGRAQVYRLAYDGRGNGRGNGRGDRRDIPPRSEGKGTTSARDDSRRCEDHPTKPAHNCPSCWADVHAGDRPHSHIGKRWTA